MYRILKISYSPVLGAWAALMAWAIRSFIFNTVGVDAVRLGRFEIPAAYLVAVIDGGLVGLLAGAVIAGLEKFNNSGRVWPTVIGGTVGTIVGAAGGIFGLLSAELFFQNIPVSGAPKEGLRLAGWAIFGVGVGIGPGIATASIKKSLFSSVGGCLGGIVGGGLFIVLLALFARYTLTSSAIGFTLLGLFVGLFIALAQEAAKQATLKITEQRIASRPKEGMLFNIDKKRITIGSGNRDDWVINNDPAVVPHQIEIRQEGGQFVLHSMKPPSLAVIQGRPVQQQILNDDDRFRIGATEIAFRAKAT